jgi:cytochrome c5
MKKTLIVFIFAISGLSGFIVSLYLHRQSEDIRFIETYHYPATFVKQLEGDPEAGKKIFNEFCAACHAENPSIEVNAPLIGDVKRWQAYRKLKMPTLLKLTIQGNGAMPARGGCFECSDQQLEMAIRYILDQL